MYWFVADEHFFHKNIIKYSKRPFKNLDEMHEKMISNHNSVVNKKDIVVHGGDFSFGNKEETWKIINQLNGTHFFIQGDHDYWMGMKPQYDFLWKKAIETIPIMVSHYMMKSWWRSHYNSWNLHGHHHGSMKNLTEGKQYDIGVDNNNYYPVSFVQLKEIMKEKPDNFNLVKK